MANKPDNFLGGEFQFNKVGSPAPVSQNNEDTGPIIVPTNLAPRTRRNWLLLIIIILLAGVFYMISTGNGGLERTPGHGGRHATASDHTIEAPHNF